MFNIHGSSGSDARDSDVPRTSLTAFSVSRPPNVCAHSNTLCIKSFNGAAAKRSIPGIVSKITGRSPTVWAYASYQSAASSSDGSRFRTTASNAPELSWLRPCSTSCVTKEVHADATFPQCAGTKVTLSAAPVYVWSNFPRSAWVAHPVASTNAAGTDPGEACARSMRAMIYSNNGVYRSVVNELSCDKASDQHA